MSQTATEITHHGHIPREDAWAHERDEAGMHLMKELGPDLLAIAAKRKGENGMAALVEEAVAQLRSIPADKWRDAKGRIITGLLDLTKLGLTEQEIQGRLSEIKKLAGAEAREVARAALFLGDEGYGSHHGEHQTIGSEGAGTPADVVGTGANIWSSALTVSENLAKIMGR